jgi:hypothetical protein
VVLLVIAVGIAALGVMVVGIILLIVSARERLRGGGAGPSKNARLIDDRQIRLPTEHQFNPEDVEETAAWLLAELTDLKQYRDNVLRVVRENTRLNDRLQAYRGRQITWQFPVTQITTEAIYLDTRWATHDGTRWVADLEPVGHGRVSGLNTQTSFQVVFHHRKPDAHLIPALRGQPSASLDIDGEIGPDRSIQLKAGDILKIKGTIKDLHFTTPMEVAFPDVACELADVVVLE